MMTPISAHARRIAPLASAALAAVLGACAYGPSIAPVTTPAAAPAAPVGVTPLTPGQTFTYNEINGFNRYQRATIVREVVAAGPETRIRSRTIEGKPIDDARLVGGNLRDGVLSDRAAGALEPALELRPFPLTAGAKWRQVVQRADPMWKEQRPVRVDGVVRGWETIRVPAGEFRVVKIERYMYLGDWDPFRLQTERFEEEWYSPDLGVPVRLTAREWYEMRPGRVPRALMPGDWYVQELASYKR